MKNFIACALVGFCSLITAAIAGDTPAEGQDYHLFYFHGRIVEDGLPAISPEFGEYEFVKITEALQRSGFVLHAKQRVANADIDTEADEAVAQIHALLAEGVPADHITIIGASKGSQIAARVSHRIANPETKLVILAGCWPQMVDTLIENEIHFYGAVLEIRDVADKGVAPGCWEVVDSSPYVRWHKAIVTELRVSHGLIYRPYPEWVVPTLEWVTAPVLSLDRIKRPDE